MRTSDSEISPIADPSWQLIEEGIDPAREREIESLFAIGNGYLGIRASIAEDSGFSRPATFVAGIYVPDGGLGPRLAVLPHLFRFEVTVEKEPLLLDSVRVLLHRRRLDFRQGILWREWRQQDPSGRITRLTCIHLASLADRHTLLQSVAITAENYAGKVSITGHLSPSKTTRSDIEATAAESGALLMRLSGKEIGIASAASDGHNAVGSTLASSDPASGEQTWSWEAALGETIRLDRVFSVFTSRDVTDPARVARDHLTSTCTLGFRSAIAAHLDAWRRRWEASDVRIVGDDEAQRALRFATYHLIAAANPADEHVSIGARGLTHLHEPADRRPEQDEPQPAHEDPRPAAPQREAQAAEGA
jgi:kojibiose phosphorylase